MKRLVHHLAPLFLLAVLLLLGVSSVRDGDAIWALFDGITLGLMLATFFVQFLRWRERTRRTGPQQSGPVELGRPWHDGFPH